MLLSITYIISLVQARMNFDGLNYITHCISRSRSALIATTPQASLCRVPQQQNVARRALDHAAVTTKLSKTRGGGAEII